MEPKIGIIVCGFTGDRQFVTNPYIQSVRYAKGIPVILPLVRSDRLLDEYTGLCDGFLFCGGGDITPLLFGEEPQTGNGKTDITVDLFQIRLMKRILKSRKPVLAICRGMQILSVACGGTIWQDISLIPGQTLDHMQQSASRSEVSHRIRTERGSRLREYVGSSLFVNSFHHQAVNSPGKNVTVSARAQDDTIEAIEIKDHPFAIGVQWHPECMYRSSSEMRKLFHEFVLHSLIN
ncbi:gamma-glutamyl-gamma-aminobutyrate hydrolase family protein [Mediterraneibacter glycyrrhizinilyticus]|uniref:gamma-glutamyl-gamma-aminobutyrate hydrolase family protein n=1 Tax=Mediterraneibacter glycyrrhizinilyticus TaxID=342942 RepID=UPI0025A46C8D|nr:gamma-glutamyl-gamma-aminobutyrate hydrolase family protein [Mediterraneibacter glycyrrhizinilyticus]MDM8211108.1 gamma-glutamyl-gamma-aminobutyrate hydrolase family protein [Mediterraneibacter glycyrrhizinilyticus]